MRLRGLNGYFLMALLAISFCVRGQGVTSSIAFECAAPASISGTSSVNVGANTTLSDATTNGVWSSSNTANATVSAGGTVYGVAAGTATITYATGDNCYSTDVVTVSSSVTYATWNPSDAGSGVALSGGNLTATITGAYSVRATISKSTGKWYWEITVGTAVSPGNRVVGIANSTASLSQYTGQNAASEGAYDYASTNLGGEYLYNASGAGSGFPNYTTGDVMGLAMDATGSPVLVHVYKNGSLVGTMSSTITGPWFPAVGAGAGTNNIYTANFGASPFAYTVPSGYNSGVY